MVRQHRVCCGNIPYPPDLHCLIITGRSEMASIRGPGEGSNCVRVTTKGPEASACSSIPDLHRLVIAGRSDALPIRRPYDGVYRIVMTTIGVEGGSHRFERSGGRDRRRLRGRARWQEYDEAT